MATVGFESIVITVLDENEKATDKNMCWMGSKIKRGC